MCWRIFILSEAKTYHCQNTKLALLETMIFHNLKWPIPVFKLSKVVKNYMQFHLRCVISRVCVQSGSTITRIWPKPHANLNKQNKKKICWVSPPPPFSTISHSISASRSHFSLIRHAYPINSTHLCPQWWGWGKSSLNAVTESYASLTSTNAMCTLLSTSQYFSNFWINR